jgi:hypothetical protein
MPDLTRVLDHLRIKPDTSAARAIEEYAQERAQPLLDALEQIKERGISEDGKIWNMDSVIADAAINAWREKK